LYVPKELQRSRRVWETPAAGAPINIGVSEMVKSEKDLCVNMGCGTKYMESSTTEKWVNVDDLSECPKARVDIKHNLNRFPYPFRDKSVSKIYCNHVLEHLTDPTRTLYEFARILKPGGVLQLNVPYFTRGYSVHKHYHGFSKWSVLTDTAQIFTPVKVTFVWDNPESFGFFLGSFCRLWNKMLNVNHFFTERFLPYKFGGINEIHFELLRPEK
jgi:SAM-dependent methyltransferase